MIAKVVILFYIAQFFQLFFFILHNE